MLSPMELKNRKIEVKKRKYYDKEQMDEYLELVFENYKALYDENQELAKNVKSLNEGVQYYHSIESTMQKALVLAEKTAKETKDAAQLKAEAMEKDAQQKADQILKQAEQEYNNMKDKCLALVQQFNQYKLQLQQVATAQLELITSDSFDVYSPELEASIYEGIDSNLPNYEGNHEVNSMIAEEQAVGEESLMEEQKSMATDSVTADSLIQDNRDMQFEDDLSKTMVLPDIKKGQHRKKSLSPKQSMDILTADTIDLGDALDEIRNTTNNEPQQVHDAIVLEPVDAVVNEPIDLETVPIETVQQEVLEPMEEEKDAPTLDSLLQSINLGKSKKKKKGQDEDPFEFLGSVDDF